MVIFALVGVLAFKLDLSWSCYLARAQSAEVQFAVSALCDTVLVELVPDEPKAEKVCEVSYNDSICCYVGGVIL